MTPAGEGMARARPWGSAGALPATRSLHAHLRGGGLIAYATESCFGLGCDPRNARAVRRLLRLKHRPQTKGLILIGGAVGQFRHFLAPLPAELSSRLAQWWPGPHTLLLPAARRCPPWLRGHHTKLAVRVTAHPQAARLCHALGMALVSTSANRSGQQPLKTWRACQRAFGAQVWVLHGRIGRRKRPSTILDPLTGGVIRA
ncbi:MAG TPA: L-threonylcarbamoyladenylate synthase [Thiobacillaceae bacterium]|nr:L-threonylcarbamoyladenylate synthase [Thiobacillaceae bacterium]HNU64302.1 L-threonylcarbamoyladenylate synthase [Thiobacillaceae bacterium]